MINATYARFAVRPKALDGIGVNPATHVNLFGVLDIPMLVSHRGEGIVNFELIGVDLRSGLDIQTHHRQNGFASDILNRLYFKVAVALNHPDYRGFTFRPASPLARALAAKIAFVNLYLTRKRGVVFFKALAHHFAHSPSRFVSYASFPFNLLGRNPAAGLCHQVDHIEPNGQRGLGFMKDCASGGADLVAAEIAGENLAPTDTMEQGRLTTFRAVNPFRVSLIADVIQAGIIIREHLAKILDGELPHWAFLLFASHNSPALLDMMVLISIYSIAGLLLDVKGYSPIVLHDYQKQIIDRFLHSSENVINIICVPRCMGQTVTRKYLDKIMGITQDMYDREIKGKF